MSISATIRGSHNSIFAKNEHGIFKGEVSSAIWSLMPDADLFNISFFQRAAEYLRNLPSDISMSDDQVIACGAELSRFTSFTSEIEELRSI
jgi:hypothetical protein